MSTLTPPINILFLGGAKRVTMAREFKRAAEARGEKAEIYSYEISTHVPIRLEAHVIEGKRWADPAIYDDLTALVERYGIRVIVPFVDGAVAVAAEMSRRMCGRLFAPTCTAEMSRDMFDKIKAAEIFAAHFLPVPLTYPDSGATLPLIAKPRHGSASKGLIMIDSEEALAQVLTKDQEYLIQQRIDRREEYSVDCYISKTDGKILSLVPRLRIEVSGGEVTHTATVIRPEVTDLARSAIEKIGLKGAVTIQIIRDLDTDKYMLMEINPRLGGGAVCSVMAGANLPAQILADAAGESQEYTCYRPYTEIVRYQQEVTFYN